MHGVSMQPGKLAVVTEWVKFGGVDNFLVSVVCVLSGYNFILT